VKETKLESFISKNGVNSRKFVGLKSFETLKTCWCLSGISSSIWRFVYSWWFLIEETLENFVDQLFDQVVIALSYKKI
jgi:hypothetical protein